ncbi:MAG: hypothetical protein AB7E79_15115 [Rhodospirillaceae bacterium]
MDEPTLSESDAQRAAQVLRRAFGDGAKAVLEDLVAATPPTHKEAHAILRTILAALSRET